MNNYLIGGSMLALLASVPAYGQNVAPQEPQDAAQQAQGLEDIIVTANRREQSVQSSSLSISVVGSEALQRAGVTNPSELQSVVPGLTIAASGAIATTFLRGVGSLSTDANAESAIAYNINGVYISRPGGIGPIFYDLERVEVLKGPQGTLYGRNATGGAINLITARPAPELHAEATLDVGTYGLVRGTGIVNVPQGDTFGLRFAGQITRRNGYLSDGYEDQESEALRIAARWTPSDRVSLLTTAEYTHVGGQGAAAVKRSQFTALPGAPWQGPSDGSISQPPSAFVPLGPVAFGTRIRDDGKLDVNVWAISAELNVDMNFATLTFIPAYRNTKPNALTYTPGFRFDTAETAEQQSYELRLANQSERLKWVAGLYYFDEDQTQFYDLQALPFQSSVVDTTLSTRSYAAFGEGTFSVADRFRLIGGLRYSKDDKTQDGISLTRNPAFVVVGRTSNFGRAKFDNVSWKAGAELDLASQSLLYATVATGYKAGGFYPSVPFPNNRFKPEKLLAYTAGSRNRFFDNKLQLNLEGFYWKYDNKQERFLGATPTGGTGLLTTNAGKATLYGGNVDVIFKPGSNDLFRASVEYLHTKYDSFTYSAYNPRPGGYSSDATGCTLGAPVLFSSNDPAVLGDSTQAVNCSGQRLVRAPKWSGSVSYEHVFELGGDRQLIAGGSAQFAGKQWLTADFIKAGEDNGYVTFDANLTYQAEHWSIQAWGRNLSQQAVYTGGFRYPFSAPRVAGGDPTLFYASIRPPRTYGVTLKAGF